MGKLALCHHSWPPPAAPEPGARDAGAEPEPTADTRLTNAAPIGARWLLCTGQPGSGKTAQNRKKITMKYVGTLAKNGREFDRGKIAFRLGAGEVIKGWDVGCAGMAVGERRQLFIPAKLGYGKRGAPPDIPPNADLNFSVELLKA